MKNKKRKLKKNKKAVKRIKKFVKRKKKILRKKPVKMVKKLTSAEKKKENLGKLAEVLIEKGHKRGFITYDEILKTFPDIENNIFFLDELYEKFSIAGIDVLEGGNLL